MSAPQKKVELYPTLWSQLPNDLLAMIFSKLPLMDLIELRTLNKEWMIRVDTSEFPPASFDPSHSNSALLLYVEGKLVVYKPNSNSWHQKSVKELFGSSSSVHLFVNPRLTPSKLELIASDGGFLCFSSRDYGHFFVCNPIRKQLIHLMLPGAVTSKRVSSSSTGAPHAQHLESKSLAPRFMYGSGGQVLGGLRIVSDTGHFQLLVVTLRGNSPLRTNIYDSLRKRWKQVQDFPLPTGEPNDHTRRLPMEMGSQFCNAQRGCVNWNDNFYTLERGMGVYWELFKFDIQRLTWSIVPLRRKAQFNLELGVYDGKLLLVESPWPFRHRFFVIQESEDEVTAWISVLEPLSKQLENLFSALPKDYRGACCFCCISTCGDTIYFLSHDHLDESNFPNYRTNCLARNFKLLAFNLHSQCLMCVEVGKNVTDLNLAEAKSCAFTPSLVLLAA